MVRSWVAGVLFLAACGGGRMNGEVPTIHDSWVAQLPADAKGPIEEAKAQHREARDEVARAQVAVDDAQRERETAAAQIDAARTDENTRKETVQAAQSRGDAAGIIA